jgi:hypothetical protein
MGVIAKFTPILPESVFTEINQFFCHKIEHGGAENTVAALRPAILGAPQLYVSR